MKCFNQSKINDRYEIQDQLGTGTLAVVYRCVDATRPDCEMAVKLLFPDIAQDDRAVSRIKRDFDHLKILSHPHIISAHEFVESSSYIGYTMELADGGGGLADRLEEDSQMPISDAINILKMLCSRIHAIHDNNMIHRNIKPKNLLLTSIGDLKISDICCSGKSGSFENDGSAVATLDYVTPEYMQNNQIDWRTDIYTAGLLGYELLTGQSPFTGNTVFETMVERLESDPVPPSSLRTEIPVLLDAVILRAMHRNPDECFRSANDMLLELEKVGKI